MPIRPICLPLTIALTALAASAAQAVPGGEIGTLRIGRYVCELAGDAAGPASIRIKSEHFTIIAASSYRAGGERGSYLLTGDDVVMTSGPFEGKRYRRISQGYLRAVEPDGTEGQLRCLITGGPTL